MECVWRLYGHRQPARYCHQQDPAVFYVCVDPYDGLTYYHLHGAGLFPECAEICDGGEAESVVLFIVRSRESYPGLIFSFYCNS